MSEATYYQRNRDVIISRAKDYLKKNDKKRLKDNATGDKYRNLSEEEKNKKREYGRNRYHMCQKKKQNLKKYQKNIVKPIKAEI